MDEIDEISILFESLASRLTPRRLESYSSQECSIVIHSTLFTQTS